LFVTYRELVILTATQQGVEIHTQHFVVQSLYRSPTALSALCGSSPSGKDLKVAAVRSRIFFSTKLFVMVSATVMSRLVPAAAFGLAAVPARPPISPEARAVHLLAKRPVAKSKATIDAAATA